MKKNNLLPYGPSFALIELSSIGKGYQVFHSILKNNLCQVLEAFPAAQGFYIYLNDSPEHVQNTLKRTQEEFQKHITNSTHIEQLQEDVAQALYHLNKTKLEQSLLVVETQTLRAALVSAQSASLKEISIYEILSPRQLDSKACVLLTSNTENLKDFLRDIKEIPELIKVELIEDLNPLFLEFFENPITS